MPCRPADAKIYSRIGGPARQGAVQQAAATKHLPHRRLRQLIEYATAASGPRLDTTATALAISLTTKAIKPAATTTNASNRITMSVPRSPTIGYIIVGIVRYKSFANRNTATRLSQ